MGFSEALRYLSRYYHKDRRGARHRHTNSTASPMRTESTANDATHVQTSPYVTVIHVRPEDLEVADLLIRRRASDRQMSERRPSEGSPQPYESESVQAKESPIEPEPAKKASAPSKSHFEPLRIEKSDKHSRGSPLRISQVWGDSRKQISPASHHTGKIWDRGDQNHEKPPSPAHGNNRCSESNNLETSPDQSTRQSSNQTMQSDGSWATVQRDPSKRCKSPIATIDSRTPSENKNPFADRHALRYSFDVTSSEEIPQPHRQLSCGNREQNSCCNNRRSLSVFWQSSRGHVPPRASSRSLDEISSRIFCGPGAPRRERIRSRAIIRFNTSAEGLGIVLPTKSGREMINSEGDCIPERSNSILGRIRSVRSNIGLRHRNSAKRTLRRIKTMANLTLRYPIDQLKGKSLEELTRLGGKSYFDLPERYGPHALILPTCFSSTMNYLLKYGPGIDYLYEDHGDNEVVCTLYSQYADQVLSAETSMDKIDKTTRVVEQPTELMPPPGPTSAQGPGFVHDVSTVFCHLLCGLPGGILGSKNLCEVLQKIQEYDFENPLVARDAERGGYLPDLPLPMAAKIRLIAHALVAMTNDLQFDLICSVFGLLSFTADVNAKISSLRNFTTWLKLPDSSLMAKRFSFVLAEPKSIRLAVDKDSVVGDPEMNTTMEMVIDHWKDICLQFRRMGIF
ncbi:hypothetical protein GX48_07525 [Paracoccidioides brasiliensis]|nr:hypothetical protein GX48_07525 [Paracoccidioides brasiliensis]